MPLMEETASSGVPARLEVASNLYGPVPTRHKRPLPRSCDSEDIVTPASSISPTYEKWSPSSS